MRHYLGTACNDTRFNFSSREQIYAKAEYQALRKEFVTTSASMLREFDKSSEAELEKKIKEYLGDMDSRRLELEGEGE